MFGHFPVRYFDIYSPWQQSKVSQLRSFHSSNAQLFQSTEHGAEKAVFNSSLLLKLYFLLVELTSISNLPNGLHLRPSRSSPTVTVKLTVYYTIRDIWMTCMKTLTSGILSCCLSSQFWCAVPVHHSSAQTFGQWFGFSKIYVRVDDCVIDGRCLEIVPCSHNICFY